jgi:AAA+ superfamily predicted ATPase
MHSLAHATKSTFAKVDGTEQSFLAGFPAWARQLADLYFSGTSCLFVLHGNVYDLIETGEGKSRRFCDLKEFLATQLFGTWDAVLEYDLGRGLRPLAAGNADRLKAMTRVLSPLWGEPASWPNDPDRVVAQLDRLVERILVDSSPTAPAAGKIGCQSLGVVFDHAQFVIPPGDAQMLAPVAASRLVRMLGWSQSPLIRRANVAFCLIAERLSELNDRLVQSPHVATIEVPLPDRAARRSFVAASTPATAAADPLEDELEIDRIADAAAGLSLVNIRVLLSQTGDDKTAGSDAFRRAKKTLIERQCGDLVEFIEPRRTLADVVGHDAACDRLEQDARWLSEGKLEVAPMGYLICGPVGTGKSYLAECYAGSVGIPCVKLRNVRSKYVGETEANLQRVLSVLRSLGPVVVIIDEADAALGSRQAEGDSGTSSRVFAMLAAQMGDTQYRGKIVWMLLTSRPELLPIDLKRQGRAEVHIPLFYPQSAEEIAPMFAAMAAKNNVALAADALDAVSNVTDVSGADIESMVLAARRRSLVANRKEVNREDLAAAVASFLPSSQGLEKQYQELCAVLECTDVEFLPHDWREQVATPEDRAKLQQQAAALAELL